jgi:hypothetical protein
MEILKKKYALLFCFLLCLLLRVQHEVSFPLLDSDYGAQIEAAKNFSEGHGFSNQEVKADHITEKNFIPLRKWPIGYPMAVLFCHLFTRDWVWAQVVLQVAGALLLVFAFKKLMVYFQVRETIRSLVYLWLAFTPTPFFYAGTSDLLTAGLFLFALYWLLKAVDTGKASYYMAIIVVSFIMAVLRFSCIPNLVIVPLFLCIVSFFRREKRFAVAALVVLVASGAMTYAFYRLFPIDSSRLNFTNRLMRMDLLWKNMEWFDPFPLKSFLFTRPFEYRFPSNQVFLLSYRIGTLLLSVLIVFFMARFLVRREKCSNWYILFKMHSPTSQLFRISMVTFAVIVGFISLQSLTTQPEHDSFGPPWMPPLWTFVYCTRYFIWPMVLLMLIGIIWLNDRSQRGRFPGVIYGILLAYSVFYFCFINYQLYFPGGNGGGSQWVNNKDELDAVALVTRESASEPGAVHILTSWKRDEYPSPALILGDEHYCMSYKRIVNGDFNAETGGNFLYLLTPKQFRIRDHSSLMSKAEPVYEKEMADGKLIKLRLK